MVVRVAGGREAWRAFRAAVQLGWEISSNWTEPLLFFIYSVLRPVSMALILVVMYRVVTGGRPDTMPFLAFLIVGTAFWGFVQNGLQGLADAVLEDRGRYHMLKYTYLAPQPFMLYLVGRGAVQLANAMVSALIVLVLATIALELHIDPLRVNYPLLITACVLAFAAIVAVSTTFSVLLLGGRDTQGYGEVAAQVLYVVSGAIFPLSVLPAPLAMLASLSPLPYWMELARRAILHQQALLMFPSLGDEAVLLRLAGTTLGTLVLARLAFRWAERGARRRGDIDRESHW